MSQTLVAIVGMACRLPGAANVDEFWAGLCDGRDPLARTAASGPPAKRDASEFWVDTNSLLPDVGHFDATFFGMNPREAAATDPQHRLFLECAWEALEDSGWSLDRDSRNVGVYGALNFSQYNNEVVEGGRFLDALPFQIAMDKDYLCTRVSHICGLAGPAFTVLCGCSSSLAAIHVAHQAIRSGECDAALAGGVSIPGPRADRHYYMSGGMLSPDGHVKAFDADAKGTVFTEGCGVVMLERLDKALEEGRRIYAVLRGSAVNNDGDPGVGFTTPCRAGQAALLKKSLNVAGVAAESIGLVEAHGTGTVIGDATEISALNHTFGDASPGQCALGSVKSNTGHLAAAAGVAGLIKTALAIRHGLVPGNLHFKTPNPELDLVNGPFYVPTETAPWRRMDGPRRATISSFGVGGTNAHAILEEWPAALSHPTRRAWHALPLSAKSGAALSAMRARLSHRLVDVSDQDLADTALTLAKGRTQFDHRAVAITRAGGEAADVLGGAHPERLLERRGTTPPKMAFMFPGQGAQFAGMGRGLYAQEPAFRKLADECLAALDGDAAAELKAMLYADTPAPGAAEKLKQTEFAQPALFITEFALSGLFEHYGVTAEAFIGHSIGEYVAACRAGVLALPDALRLVSARGRLMQTAPRGAMLSVSASLDVISDFLQPTIDVAAANAPEQHVLAGAIEDIRSVQDKLEAAGLATRLLVTSHAFHSRLLDGCLADYAHVLAQATMRPPTRPYVSNVTGDFITEADLSDPAYWVRHARQPVQFAAGVQRLLDQGVTHFVEVGPGRALSTLVKQCAGPTSGIRTINGMRSADSDEDDDLQFLKALAGAWTSGASVDWARLYEGEVRQVASLPSYPFQRSLHWIDNTGWGEKPNKGAITPDKLPIDAWLYAPSWRQAGPCIAREPKTAADECRRVLVCAPDADFATRLAAQLPGSPPTVVTPGEAFARTSPASFVVDPRAPADFAKLMDALATDGQVPDTLIYAWTADGGRPAADSMLGHVEGRGLFALQRLFREAITRTDRPLSIRVITRGACDVTGGEALHPENAGVIDFMRLIGLEHPGFSAKVVDLGDPGPVDFESLATEALSGEEPLVALRHGRRWVLEYRRLPPTAAPKTLREGGVYLVIGGMGHLGLELAQHLATKWRAHLTLVGRSPPPADGDLGDPAEEPDVRNNASLRRGMLSRIRHHAGSLSILQADATDEGQLRRVREEILARHGRIDGIVFAAGRLGTALTACTEDGLKAHADLIHPKAAGVEALEAVFSGEALDFCMVLSSLSRVAPVVGQASYAAANTIADAVVQRRNRSARRKWQSVLWDLWAQTELWEDMSLDAGGPDGVIAHGTSGQARVARAMRLAIAPDEGLAVFEHILAIPAQQVVVSTHDLAARLARHVANEETGAPEDEAPGELFGRPDLDSPYEAPQGEAEVAMTGIWRELLGVDGIGRHDDFFELGGHSLMSVKLIAQIQVRFGREARLEDVLKAPTVARLTERLLDAPPPAAKAEAPREPVSA